MMAELCGFALVGLFAVGSAAAAQVPAGMPADVPTAASSAPPTLPEPASSAWPFPSTFPQTSGTGRLAGGASLWTDFIYDDYGASNLKGLPTSNYDQSSGLAARQGQYVYPAGPADNNGADIFRAGVGLHGAFTYWRVDWVTLADPSVPVAEWTFDTDNNALTGASAWPAGAGVSSAGIDQALVVSSRGAWLINPLTGTRTDVLTHGGALTVDRGSKSFIVAVPRTLMPVSGTWRVRLAAGLADPAGQGFAAPYVGGTSSGPSPTAERVYNITFRTVAQEPPVFTSGTTDAQVALAQQLIAGTPLGSVLGLDGIARSITGNFWMDDDQADTLAAGDVSKFSLPVGWAQLGAARTTFEPQPPGYSIRWYVSRLSLGAGQVVNDGSEGDFRPTLLERVQPYAVYVPTEYRHGHPLPLTWIEHSLEVNYNQYGALDPQLIQQLCQARDSICATTEGFGPSGWYYNEAETDFWQVWRSLAGAFSLDPARTVISGYSMGGWASYKLAFEHPDDFAGAFVIDGPVICGIQFYPGVNGFAYSDPACSKDGQSQPFVHNALWIPYVIDHTYADELVPTTGVLAQTQTFDRLGQRYDLFIHTGADHLFYAVEDRFGDAVAAVGKPVRKVNPGRFTYSWYPSLDNAALGIGATGDYWLSGFKARDRRFGTIATVQAYDAALPEPKVTDQRFGPALVTQPIPGTETRLTWRLGARPPARKQMTLNLTDVAGMTLDARAAKLQTGTITVTGDGATKLTIANLPFGTTVLEHGRRVAVAGARGIATVRLPRGTTVLTLVRPGARTGGGTVRRRPAPSFTG
jgi:pimeloyl-ACP methyl ester carboxylesterase